MSSFESQFCSAKLQFTQKLWQSSYYPDNSSCFELFYGVMTEYIQGYISAYSYLMLYLTVIFLERRNRKWIFFTVSLETESEPRVATEKMCRTCFPADAVCSYPSRDRIQPVHYQKGIHSNKHNISSIWKKRELRQEAAKRSLSSEKEGRGWSRKHFSGSLFLRIFFPIRGASSFKMVCKLLSNVSSFVKITLVQFQEFYQAFYTEKLKAGHTLETNIRSQSIAFVSRNLSCLGQCHFRRLGSFGK